MRDLNLHIREMNFPIGEMVESEKYSEIERIVGRDHRRDVLHIDSAYRSRCVCFFTRDKSDILKNRTQLEARSWAFDFFIPTTTGTASWSF
jgi:hypothetical protein